MISPKKIKKTEKTAEPVEEKNEISFKFGGLDITVLNQENEYVPDPTPDILVPKDQEQAIALAVTQNLPIMLQGEAGTGKTSIARLLAYKRKQGYTRINMTGYATPDELIGSKSVKDGKTYYEYGVLTQAMIEGHICVLDELNATPPDCLFILHGLLDDDRRITLPNGEIIRPHEDFRFFATMNPDYEGTKSLNRALLDRFPIILIMKTLDAIKEQKLIAERVGIPEGIAGSMVAIAQMSRKNYKDQKSLTYISTRTLLQWAGLLQNHVDMKDAYEIAIVNKARVEERTSFMDYYGAIFKTKVASDPQNEIVFVTMEQKDTMERENREAKDIATRVLAENSQLKRYKLEYEQLKNHYDQNGDVVRENETLKAKLKKFKEVMDIV